MTSGEMEEEREPLIDAGPTTTYSDLLKAYALITNDDGEGDALEGDFNPSILAHSLEAYLKWPASMSIGDIGQSENDLEHVPEGSITPSDTASWKWEMLFTVAYALSFVYFVWSIKFANQGNAMQLLIVNSLALLCSSLLLRAPNFTAKSMAVLFPTSLAILPFLGYPSMPKYGMCGFLVIALLLSVFIYFKRSVLKEGINMLGAIQSTNILASLLFGLVYSLLVMYLAIPNDAIHILIWIWITESLLNLQSTGIARTAFTWYHRTIPPDLSLWHRFSVSILSGILLTPFLPLRLSLLIIKSHSRHPWFAFLVRYLEPASPYSLIYASINDKPCLHAGHSMGGLT